MLRNSQPESEECPTCRALWLNRRPRWRVGCLFSRRWQKGLLSKKLAAELALALAGINHCQYCASSHTVLSKFAGLNDAQIVNALEGRVEDSKDAAAVDFAKIVVEKRGRIDDDDFNCVRDAGFTPVKSSRMSPSTSSLTISISSHEQTSIGLKSV